MVEIDDKSIDTNHLPGSGIVRRMVTSISSQILNNNNNNNNTISSISNNNSCNKIDELKFKNSPHLNRNSISSSFLSTKTKSVVSDLKKAIESNKHKTTTTITEDFTSSLSSGNHPPSRTNSLINKLSANFKNDSKIAPITFKHSQPKPYQLQETVDGIQIQIKQPHLISVVVKNNCVDYTPEKIQKTSIKIYPLKSGRTTIGTAQSNDIVLSGAGVEDEHCFIENFIDSNRKQTFNNKFSQVVLYPIGRLCSVDGVIVDKPFKLNSGK